MIDYHIHTKLCKHASGEVYQYVENCINAGIKEMAFTDHIPLPRNFDSSHRMGYHEMDIYCNWIDEARNRYPEIKIRLGVEADYYEGFEDFISEFTQKFELDLVIMSIHFIKHWPGDNWILNYSFPHKTQNDIYEDYLAVLINGIQTGLFDVLGHVDLIKKPGDSLVKVIPDKVEKLLFEIKKNKIAIEINTSGFRREVCEPYPGFDWFPYIKKYELPITIGSDAHNPEQVALEFEFVYSQIEKYGIDKLVSFEKRNMRLYSILAI
jgi:histidinol-phosphatase (PHP family)